MRIIESSGPPSIGPHFHAVVAGGLVFTSDQITLNPANGEIIEIEAVAELA